jgi:N-sulfoglucosamine sulfohydrolase
MSVIKRVFRLEILFCIPLAAVIMLSCSQAKSPKIPGTQPNILFAISDDQSFPYASAYGTKGIRTPGFDQVAKTGVLFNNAFVAAPGCSPSRAAILTGKNIWQLEEAGTHASYFPKKFTVFTDLLEEAGYELGYTGKPWGPGNWQDAGWLRNPVGPGFNKHVMDSVPANGIQKRNYSANFNEFLSQKEVGKPFFFWYGCHEPHRRYEDGSGLRSGMKLNEVELPSFLPDDEIVRSDVADYIFEIEWFDRHLHKMIDLLKEKGELENTIIVVTADNGMPFPYAKANVQEYGTHVPLAICWPANIKGNRIVGDLVGMIDLAPTFLEIAGIEDVPEMTGKSLSAILFSEQEGNVDDDREYVLTGRERHTHARPDNLGYPARAIRTADYLYVRNFKPELWPAGNPPPPGSSEKDLEKGYVSLWPGYFDIDASPSKSFMIDNMDKWPQLFEVAYNKRSGEQLYDIHNDPGCLKNIANDPSYQKIKDELSLLLEDELKRQGDPRMLGNGHIFDSYPRISSMRDYPGFKERGKYNPAFQ